MNSIVIETAIGLVLAFSLLSVAASWVSEYLRRFLNNEQNRSRFLMHHLEAMLAGSADDSYVKKVLSNPLVAVLDLSGNLTGADYVDGKNLTRAILQYAGEVAHLPGELQQLITDLGNKADEQVTLVNAWVDKQFATMSALFKKNQYRWSFVIGLVFAVLLNIDTIQMAQVFWKDPTLRAAVVQSAQDVTLPDPVPAESGDQSLDTARDQALIAIDTLLDTNLPILWWTETRPASLTGESVSLAVFEEGRDPRVLGDVFSSLDMLLSKIVGLLITAVAVSRGSDFWFNLLRKLTHRG